MKKYFIFLIFLLLVGCANNPYRTHYKSYNTYVEKPLENKKDVIVEKVGSFSLLSTMNKYIENGYYPLGYSLFNDENLKEKKIKKFAGEIGANLALYSQTYLGKYSYQTIASIPVYSTTTSSGSIYNYDIGNMYYSGNSVTQSTQYIPITETVYMYKYESVFLKKLTEEEIGYGLDLNDIDELRNELEIDKNITEGIVVRYVVKGSRAYKDGFLRGDIIRKINGKKIINLSSLEDIEKVSDKKPLVHEILRNGKIKKIILKPRNKK